MTHIEPEKREDWEYQMNAPLPGREKKQPTESMAEIEGQGFMAMMAQHQQVTGKSKGA